VPVGIDLDAGENGVWGAGRRSAQDASIAMFTLGMPVVDKAVNQRKTSCLGRPKNRATQL
jgi:hypothetical protein